MKDRLIPRLLAALLVICMGSAGTAKAHPMQETQVLVRVEPDRWHLRLVMPSVELVYALIQEGKIAAPPPGFIRYPAPSKALVSNYLASHLAAASPDGTHWRILQQRLIAPDNALEDGAPEKDWIAEIDLVAPDHRQHGAMRLTYGIITREVFNHIAIFSLEKDWGAGVLPQSPVLLGRVHRGEHTLMIAPGEGQGWKSWLQMVNLGVWHILEGMDHQAFLMTVLLTVGLVAHRRRWEKAEGRRHVLSDTLWRVSAFTIGHSISLLFTSLGWLPAGGQAIEVLIALSVAISAVHAIVPIYPGRESAFAAFFGLIHGMAFATAIRDMNLPTGQIIAATFGFNIGIELAQLALVALILPFLIVVRKTPSGEPAIRIPAALGALILALFWIAQRLSLAVG